MKLFRALSLGLLLILFLSQALIVSTTEHSAISKEGFESRKYFPGDVVHIIVEAPIDTTRVIAAMPDKQRVEMSFDRQANVWHGYWEVPAGFEKGAYYSELIAEDIEGKIFKGKTTEFYVGEPAMALILRVKVTEEALYEERIKELAAEAEILEREARAKARQVEMLTRKLKKLVVQPEVKPKKNEIAKRLSLMLAARDYVAKQQYEEAKAQLKALLKMDPDNLEIKLMLSRLHLVMKAKEKEE